MTEQLTVEPVGSENGQVPPPPAAAPNSGPPSEAPAADSPPPSAPTPAPTVEPGLLPRPHEQVERLLVSAGLVAKPDPEAEKVSHLLVQKLARSLSGSDEEVIDDLSVKQAFLHYRFTSPVMSYERTDRYYGYLDTVLNLTSIAAGIGASLVAALAAPKVWAIGLGLIIAACQTLSQWLKPSQRAVRRAHAAADLRTEAWNLLQGHDRYRGKPIDQAWDTFVCQVERVESREETAEEHEAQTAPGSGRARGH